MLLCFSSLVRADAPGEAALSLNGPLLPEGSPSDASGTFKIESVFKGLVVDLGAEVAIRALLLQADGDDVYSVDGSEDGLRWRTIWRAPRYPGNPGLRTRTQVLGEATSARFLRIRPTVGDGSYSVSRLKVYSTLPKLWPPALDETRSSLPLFPNLGPDTVQQLIQALSVLALLALVWRLSRTSISSRALGRFRVTLGALTLLSLLGFWNFLNFHHYAGLVQPWDTYHYYMGAKYFREVGYTGLYACSAVAEADDTRAEDVAERQLRDLETNQVVDARSVLENAEAWRERFSPERWKAFRSDLRFFRRAMGEGLWKESQLDHGFNATPAWILAGAALANLVEPSRVSIACLALLDVLLLLGAWAFMRWAFEFEAAAVAALFFGLNAFARFAWSGGAFLRYDWLFLAIAGVCLLRKDREFSAGLAIGYSSALRLFPSLMLLGLAVGWCTQAFRKRRWGALLSQWRVAAGAGVALLTLSVLSVVATGRPSAWREFSENTRRFLSTDAENFIGLPVLAAYRPSQQMDLLIDPMEGDPYALWNAARKEARASSVPFVALGGILYVALMVGASRRLPPWALAVLGSGSALVLLRVANYYCSWLLLYGLLFELSPLVGVAVLSVAWASNLAAGAWPAWEERALALSVLGVALVFGTAARFAFEKSPPRPEP